MAKIDKEQLLKNKFWIMLGSAGLLLLICWLVLLISGSSAGDAQRQKFDKALKESETNAKGQPKNENFRKPWADYGDKFTKQKTTVWEQAWKTQETMYVFPWQDKARFDKVQYYDDDVTPDSNAARKIYAQSLYLKQFTDADLTKLVAPVEFKDGETGFKQIMGPAGSGGGGNAPGMGEGATGGRKMGPTMPGMPAGGGGGSSVSGRAIDSVWGNLENTPTMEEVWLAQEDFWVKRELLKIIREALDKYARFQPVEFPKDEALPAKVVNRFRFRNPSWEITLLIEEVKDKGRTTTTISPDSTIRNVSVTGRTQLVANALTGKGLKFVIKQGGRDFPLTIEGEPVPHDESVKFKKSTPVESINFKNEIGLEQVLEYATSPIRRIDDLRTAKNSHRLAFKPLVVNAAITKVEKKEEAAAPESAGGVTGAPAGMTMSGGRSPEGGPGGGSATAANLTPNGLERERYLLTNEQCRHLPVGMVLVVDQAAINDVLIAVANSPLRIQITQVHLLHVHDSGPQAGGDTAPSGGEGTPGEGRPSGPTMPAGGPMMPGGLGKPGFPLGGTGAEVSEGDNNLFELTVYGVATLYERYPARSPKEVAPDPANSTSGK